MYRKFIVDINNKLLCKVLIENAALFNSTFTPQPPREKRKGRRGIQLKSPIYVNIKLTPRSFIAHL